MEKRRFDAWVLFIFILLLVWAVGFYGYGDVKRVLIVSQSSDFKNEVVGSLREELKQSSIEFTVTDISSLRKVREDEWDAIVIVHAVKMGRIKNQVKRFLDNVENWEKVIVVTTYGSEDPVPSMYGIDSISSASEKDQVKPVTTEIKTRLHNILKI